MVFGKSRPGVLFYPSGYNLRASNIPAIHVFRFGLFPCFFQNNKDKLADIEGYQIDDAAQMNDISYLEELAEEISRLSRFNFDKNMPKSAAKDLYSIWIRNSIQKKAADKVFIARETNSLKPVGIVTVKNESMKSELVLVGVSKEHSGKGIASLLLQQAFLFLKEKGINIAKVNTQGRNIPAINLYGKNGFLIKKITLFYHLWI